MGAEISESLTRRWLELHDRQDRNSLETGEYIALTHMISGARFFGMLPDREQEIIRDVWAEEAYNVIVHGTAHYRPDPDTRSYTVIIKLTTEELYAVDARSHEEAIEAVKLGHAELVDTMERDYSENSYEGEPNYGEHDMDERHVEERIAELYEDRQGYIEAQWEDHNREVAEHRSYDPPDEF